MGLSFSGQEVSSRGLSRLCSSFRILASALARASGSSSSTSRVKANQRHLRICVAQVNDHILFAEVQALPHQSWSATGQLLLMELPKLPLPQRITQQDKDNLGRDDIEVPG